MGLGRSPAVRACTGRPAHRSLRTAGFHGRRRDLQLPTTLCPRPRQVKPKPAPGDPGRTRRASAWPCSARGPELPPGPSGTRLRLGVGGKDKQSRTYWHRLRIENSRMSSEREKGCRGAAAAASSVLGAAGVLCPLRQGRCVFLGMKGPRSHRAYAPRPARSLGRRQVLRARLPGARSLGREGTQAPRHLRPTRPVLRQGQKRAPWPGPREGRGQQAGRQVGDLWKTRCRRRSWWLQSGRGAGHGSRRHFLSSFLTWCTQRGSRPPGPHARTSSGEGTLWSAEVLGPGSLAGLGGALRGGGAPVLQETWPLSSRRVRGSSRPGLPSGPPAPLHAAGHRRLCCRRGGLLARVGRARGAAECPPAPRHRTPGAGHPAYTQCAEVQGSNALAEETR